MFHRKDAVLMAVAGLLASSGFAMADSTDLKAPTLSLDPSIVTAQAAPATATTYDTLLMHELDTVGAAHTISDYGLKVYGWFEGGYTYNHRNHGQTFIVPGPFNHEFGNHFMVNQIDLRIEKQVDLSKFDVGGMVELMYGTDAARIHSTGWGFNGSDATDNNQPSDPLAVANLHPIMQFDVPQAYVDVALPVGNGLKIRAGKFVTLLGYETIDPRTNPFYSHSYLFNAVPFTQTGVLGSYAFNDQWALTAGVTRGWDITMEDNNAAIDVLGQLAYTPNKQLAAYLNFTCGPENEGDSSHYRTTIDPVITYQVTDQLKLGAEFLYIYDGGINAFAPSGVSHGYGDVWGAALYAGYKINDYVTANARLEKCHTYLNNFGGLSHDALTVIGPGAPTINVYECTLGVTITPLPQDTIGKNLTFRPEVRYDWSEDKVYTSGGQFFQDQLTFGCDVIFTF